MTVLYLAILYTVYLLSMRIIDFLDERSERAHKVELAKAQTPQPQPERPVVEQPMEPQKEKETDESPGDNPDNRQPNIFPEHPSDSGAGGVHNEIERSDKGS